MACRAGVGLKAEHLRTILETAPDVGFFEVHAENYMGKGGPPHRYLTAIRERYPLSVHGVGLSIGAARPLDQNHLHRLRTLVDRYSPIREAFAASLRDENLVLKRADAIATIAAELRGFVKRRVGSLGTLEFAFACTLIEEPERTLPTFRNARFETREDWLSRKQEGAVSEITARRIRATWAGGNVRRRRGPGAGDETHILDCVGNARFVCTVTTEGLAPRVASCLLLRGPGAVQSSC